MRFSFIFVLLIIGCNLNVNTVDTQASQSITASEQDSLFIKQYKTSSETSCNVKEAWVEYAWKNELEREKDENAKIILYKRYEAYLDQGYGACFLKDERVAATVQEALLHHDASRYKLISWVVMPNHAHFLIKPVNNHSLSEIMKKFKSYTSHEANKILQRNGKFW